MPLARRSLLMLRAIAAPAGALRTRTHEHTDRMHTVVSLLELGPDEEALGFASADMVRTQVLSEDLLVITAHRAVATVRAASTLGVVGRLITPFTYAEFEE